MKKFAPKHICMPTDFSDVADIAKSHAVTMAKKFSSEISLLHVKENYGYNVIFPNLYDDSELDIKYRKSASEKLQQHIENFSNKHGIHAQAVIADGSIAQEVLDYSEKNNIDLIVAGTHGVKGIEEFFLGSNAYRIVSKSKCPVLTAQTENLTSGYKKILLPIDETIHSREKVPMACEIAKKFNSELNLVTIISQKHDSFVRHINAIKAQVVKYIDSTGVNFSSTEVYDSNNANVAIEVAEKINADLMIIMSEKETTLSGFLLGQYAQQVVNHSKTPVLTMHAQSVEKVQNIFEGTNISFDSGNPI